MLQFCFSLLVVIFYRIFVCKIDIHFEIEKSECFIFKKMRVYGQNMDKIETLHMDKIWTYHMDKIWTYHMDKFEVYGHGIWTKYGHTIWTTFTTLSSEENLQL